MHCALCESDDMASVIRRAVRALYRGKAGVETEWSRKRF